MPWTTSSDRFVACDGGLPSNDSLRRWAGAGPGAGGGAGDDRRRPAIPCAWAMVRGPPGGGRGGRRRHLDPSPPAKTARNGPPDRSAVSAQRAGLQYAGPAAGRPRERGRAGPAGRCRLSIAPLEMADKFPIRPPRQLLLPLVPGLLAALLAALVPPATDGSAAATATQPETQQPEGQAIERDIASETGRPPSTGREAGAPRRHPTAHETRGCHQGAGRRTARDKALVKLNDLARQLRERRQEFGGDERIKQQLEPLKSLERGPADKLAQALARGDFKKAAEEIEKLKQELAKTSSGKPGQESSPSSSTPSNRSSSKWPRPTGPPRRI